MTEPLSAATIEELERLTLAYVEAREAGHLLGAGGDLILAFERHGGEHAVILSLLQSARRADELAGEVERLKKNVRELSQVALEAIRVIHCTTHGGDPRVFEPCEACSLGGVGNLRDALKKALGDGYTKLVWGLDMNVDMKELESRLSGSGR